MGLCMGMLKDQDEDQNPEFSNIAPNVNLKPATGLSPKSPKVSVGIPVKEKPQKNVSNANAVPKSPTAVAQSQKQSKEVGFGT
jgi:hypothetical protein